MRLFEDNDSIEYRVCRMCKRPLPIKHFTRRHRDTKNKTCNQCLDLLQSIVDPETMKPRKTHLHARGLESSFATHTPELVLAIRKDYDSGMSGLEIAEKYSVLPSYVTKIGKRYIWKHLKG